MKSLAMAHHPRRARIGSKSARAAAARRSQLLELLGALGSGQIGVAAFWRYMREAGLADADIDAWCHSFYRQPSHREKQNADRAGR
jgi:hypothetical protein